MLQVLCGIKYTYHTPVHTDEFHTKIKLIQNDIVWIFPMLGWQINPLKTKRICFI
jgi:hypothetical protein